MTEQPILVGITGRYGSGKSTLAEMLADLIPDARVVAFADALKADIHQVAREWGIEPTPEELAARKGDVFGPLYQGWGEMMRAFRREDHWIRRLEGHLPDRAIVADVRYPNEHDWIRGRGGLIVAVSGPCRRTGDARSPDHPSERQVPEVARGADVAVINDCTLEALRTHARGVARLVLSRVGGGRTP